jgi:hypothetical protein
MPTLDGYLSAHVRQRAPLHTNYASVERRFKRNVRDDFSHRRFIANHSKGRPMQSGELIAGLAK